MLSKNECYLYYDYLYFFEDNSIKLSDNVNNVWIEIELLKFSYRRGLKP